MCRSARLFIALSLLTSGAALVAPKAGASTAPLTCSTVRGDFSYDPPLPSVLDTTVVTSTLTGSGEFGGCVGASVTGGTWTATNTFTGSCLTGVGSAGPSSRLNVTWSDLRTSTATFTLRFVGLPAFPARRFEMAIRITAGLYAGYEATVFLAVVGAPGTCITIPDTRDDYTNSGPLVFAPAPPGTSCKTFAGAATVTPGLVATSKNQTIAMTGAIGGCTGGGVTKGASKATTIIKNATCSSLAKTGTKGTITETIKWNTGKSSILVGSAVVGPKVGQATIAVKVTKGRFVGLRGSQVITLAKSGSCSDTTPLKKLTTKAVTPLVIK